ncbi:hypothetical protein KKB98_00940 [Patescibacteria group bacterium]|nr:hypothetical protein [Patescibacteria group bacterium]
MPLKKILVVLIVLLVLSATLLLIYNYFFKEEMEPSDKTTEQTASSYWSDKIKTISQEPAIGAAVDGQKIKYYSSNNGNVFESDFDGSNQTRVSSNILTDLLEILWSPSKDKVIAIFDERGLPKKYLYDYSTKITTPLATQVRWIAWSPDEDKIAYQYYNSQNEDNNISISNPDGSEWVNVFSTRMKNLIIEWPSRNKISIRTRPSGLAKSIVYAINLPNNNIEKILGEAYGMSVLWSPNSNKILFSETNSDGKNLKLKIMDWDKQTIKELSFISLPEKCAWSQDNRNIFCAIPKKISSSAVLPDDYYKNKILFSDDFWRIDSDTEEAIKIFEGEDNLENSYDAQKVILSPQEDYLFFINKRDGLLCSLEL